MTNIRYGLSPWVVQRGKILTYTGPLRKMLLIEYIMTIQNTAQFGFDKGPNLMGQAMDAVRTRTSPPQRGQAPPGKVRS